MISMRMLKLLDTSICKPFNIIFIFCLTRAEKNKCRTNTQKNDKQRVKNYRPVSLLPAFCFSLSVFFRPRQICTRQKRENRISLLKLELFWNVCSIFLSKDKVIVLYTLKYFWEHRRKGKTQDQMNHPLLHFLLSFESFNF